MKMLKKLLAVVLTGAMALTLFTACGGNAVGDKSIADALNDMAKAQGVKATFTPQAKEREMAKAVAALLEGRTIDAYDNRYDEIKEILECNDGGANANNFVWVGWVLTDELGTSGQAFDLQNQVLEANDARNGASLGNQKPADARFMGSALCKVVDKGKPVTVRIIVVTAKAEG